MDENEIRVPPGYVQEPHATPAPESPQPAPTWQPAPPSTPAWQSEGVPPPAAPKPGRFGWLALLGAALLGGLIGAAAVSGLVFGFAGGFARPATIIQRVVSPPGAVNLVATQTAQPDEAVAAKVTPSVVNVTIEKQVTDPFGRSGVQGGNGSGVIIRSDGYILTNNHVVEGADTITVPIGLEKKVAKVVGADPVTDIAVIKVDATGLTPAQLGDSDALRVGQGVIAVGSPFGLDHTVTSGIISALHRSGDSGQDASTYTNLIQTDAAINPGNSGGALADIAGKVIGINTLIQTGGAAQSAGIGFAIPIKLASVVADQLISTGKASHAFLGVSMQTLDQALAQQLKTKVKAGAVVQDVVSGSPADKSAIKKGDIITSIDGQPVETSQDAVSIIRVHKVGDVAQVELDRGGKQLTVSATLAEAPAR